MRTILKTSGYCLFVALGFHLVHILDTARWALVEPLPYLIHAVVQLGIEASLLTVVALWFLRRGWISLAAAWETATVGWALLHVVDVHMVRLMDLSLWHAFLSTVGEGWENFVEILHASNVPLGLYAAMTGAAALVVGGLFVGFRYKLVRESEGLTLPPPGVGVWTSIACLSLLGAVALMDCTSAEGCSSSAIQKLSRSLPWKHRIVEMQAEEQIELRPLAAAWSGLPQASSPAMVRPSERPPVFLFIIESLRADALTERTAPHLQAFAQQHYSSTHSFANANATPLSWMAILSGLQPSRWGSDAITHLQGSPGLQALQSLGYEIHVHSASRLSYYELDRKLFGPSGEMVKSLFTALSDLDQPAWQRDALVMQHLTDHLSEQSGEGELHIVFLEGTHFAYSWPEDQTLFQPVSSPAAGMLAFWGLADLNALRNRYANSIHYLDTQMGQFLGRLKQQGLYDRAQIVITADHGEEFFEQGHLFHASALDEEQVRVPIYWKINSADHPAPTEQLLVSHVDILPTLLHVLSGQELPGLFDGQSLFSRNRPPYVISWRYNFQSPPHEFAIHTHSGCLRGSLSDPMAAADSSHVTVSAGSAGLGRLSTRKLLQNPGCQQALERFFRRR